MRILIVGAGIAGLTAAILLKAQGNEVVVAERRRGPAPEGYMIDFFGPGFDVAQRMGLGAALQAIHYPVESLLLVDRDGKITANLRYPQLRRTIFANRHYNFLRGDLEQVLLERLGGPTAVRFGLSPERMAPETDAVIAWMSDGVVENFDLVIGADGARSSVRDFVFSPLASRIVYLGCHTVAYVIDDVPTGVVLNAFSSLTIPGLTAAVYPVRGQRTAAFFAYRAKYPVERRTSAACRAELEATCRRQGAMVDGLLDRFPDGGDVFYDDVFQVQTDRWSRDRVVLLGDACGCVSLVAGQGASMAMAGAWVLAEELGRPGADLGTALERYEARLRPSVERRQRTGRRNVRWFLPRSEFAIWLRDRISVLGTKPPFAHLIGRSLGASAIPPA